MFQQKKQVQAPLSSGAQSPVKRAKEAHNHQQQRTSRCDSRGSGNDLFELDESELLDIACVCVLHDDDYDNVESSAALSTLNYSFNTEVISKADTKEDSARETMNLVEKLRMQYAI